MRSLRLLVALLMELGWLSLRPPPGALAAGVVGSGTPASCTEAELEAALAGGGVVTFDCGGPANIIITGRKTIAQETTIDGGSGAVTIDGNHGVGVFWVNSGVTFAVKNLTVANGYGTGGGIYNEGGTLTVTNSTFSGNTAPGLPFVGPGFGGGIYNRDGPLTVTNSTFSDNSASNGGGIFNDGTLAVINSTFSGNSALGSDMSGGGGIFSGGGGIFNNRGALLTITDTTFAANGADDTGGGIANAGRLTVTNSTFSGNSAGRGGGGIFNEGGTLNITNCTVSSNSADKGGGIANEGTLAVINSTFSGNSATDGEGGGIANGSGALTISNSIVAKSASGGNCAGTITDSGHNLDDGTTCGFSAANGSVNNTDPKLDPVGLANNGGPTQTIALLPDSPAINAGDGQVCANAPVDALDQRSYARPGTGYTNCSIGAFEFESPGPPPPCNVVGTGTSVSCTEVALDACLRGGAGFNGTVTFNCGPDPVTITITVTKTIWANTSIDGGRLITISGGHSVGVFSVNAGVTFTVQNLTIANGHGDQGGGILNGGTLTVTNSTFSGNSAEDALGGAIYNSAGTLTVTNSTFSGNSAAAGAIVEWGGAIYNRFGTLAVSDSTFSANSASIGGGIFNDVGTVTVTNSTFSGNSATDGDGGGIANGSGTLTVTNSTFSGNTAPTRVGGGIFHGGGGTLTVTNSSFSGNSAGGGGGIFNGGTLTVTNSTVTDSTFSANSASGGGGIANDGTLTVTDSTFSGNSAVYGGGGISNALDGTLTVTNSSFSGNSAADGHGGAIYNDGAPLTVTNSTFSGNSGLTGGAIANYWAFRNGTLSVTNSTFSGNRATGSGGAIDNTATCGDTNNDPCPATLTNTIVANNTGGNCNGTIIDGGHNLDDGTTCGFSTANGSLSNTNPQLDPAGLKNNSGPTQTIALQAGSPAINAGDETVCVAAPVNGLDQRGFVRPGTGYTNCSIGAYEYNSAAPCVVGTGTRARCTESALDACLPGGTGFNGAVTFNCGGPATITVTSTKTISADTTINGGSLVTISGGNSVGVFSVNGGVKGVKFTVQNLTIANGHGDQGGGILNGGTLIVFNSTLSGNSATVGGGIYNDSPGILTLANCTLSGNSAQNGGAIVNWGAATLTDCALSGNSAAGSGMGGAILNLDSLTLTNCTLNGNAAATTGEDPLNGAGGAIANFGTLMLTNSTLSGNSARRGGGMANNYLGIRPCGPSVVVTNSTFSGNHADAGAGAIDGICPTSVTNSIIANSSGANCGDPAAITDGGHNIQFPDTSCGETIPSLDPLLDPAGLKDNGGPTQTIALLPNSPAINAGDQSVCAAAPVNGLDQRGFARPGTGYTNCSIGAFEYTSGPPPSPTPTGTRLPSNTPTATGTPTAAGATATPTLTATPSPSATPTATRTANATPSASVTATATSQPGGGGGGCTVTPNQGSGAAWWLLVPAFVLAWARQRKSELRPGPRGVHAWRVVARARLLLGKDHRRPGRTRRRSPRRLGVREPQGHRQATATHREGSGGHRARSATSWLIEDIRSAGARIRLIGDGDLSAGISAAVRRTNVHAVMSIGGAPEGVLAAAALRCLNGGMEGRLVPPKPGDEERKKFEARLRHRLRRPASAPATATVTIRSPSTS